VNLFLPMLGVGIVTSVHCVAMCGPMVLTYAVKGDESGPLLKRMVPHFAYHGAKLLSYVAVGLLLGAIGSAFNLGGVRGWVTVFAGAFMVLLGLNMTGKVPALRRLTLQPPKFLMDVLQRTRRKANADSAQGTVSLATPITFGLITGLMPCGPLQAAQLAAAATGSPVSGAVAMLGFGLGTMPLMLGFGAVSGMLGAKFKKNMMVVAAVFVMVLGLVMLDRGAMLVGSPVTSASIKTAFAGTPAPAGPAEGGYTVGADGVVEVPLVIENVQFVPAALSIPADKPVRLIVDRRESNACSAQLAVPQLGVLVDLKDNATTIVDIPASKAGSYTLTCGMGMMAGTLSVGGYSR
jgi:sulfite exporter TauE/SafE